MSILVAAAEVTRLIGETTLLPHLDERAIAASNLCRALCDAGEWQAGLDLAIRLATKFEPGPRQDECEFIALECELGLERFDAVLDRAAALEHRLSGIARLDHAENRQRIQVLAGAAEVGRGRFEMGGSLLRSAYEVLLRRPDGALLGWCACNLGNLAWSQGAIESATQRYEEAIVSSNRSQDHRLKATALRNLGLVHRQQCRWKQAREELTEAAELWKNLGNGAQLVHVHRSLAVLYWKQGALESGFGECDLSSSIARSSAMLKATNTATLMRGCLDLHAGNFEGALGAFEAVRSSSLEGESARSSMLAVEFFGDVHLERALASEALENFEKLWTTAEALAPKGDIVAELRRRRAECFLLLGREHEAYDAAKEGLAHCRELGDRYEEAATYRVLALSAAAIGKYDEARQHFTQGFAYYDDIETPYEWGKLWMAYGDWLSGQHAGPYKDVAAAREAYLAARDHFSNMGARAKLREAEQKLATLDAAATPSAEPSAGPVSIIRRPQRRPSSQSALDRRGDLAWQDWYLVTRHEPFLNLLDRAARLAKSDVPILITGETGTGKELIASGIHRKSGLKGTYVPLNCAAVPKDMIESELFGHVRGAFSGAVAERSGLVEMASRGTLFLDEVGEMSEAMQAKLLRFLESGEYRRVGESTHREVKTRLVAATNVPRESLEKGDDFRRDLYWRLGQGFLEVPALRHRHGDVPLLIDHFLRLEARKMNKPALRISDEAQAELEQYAWPGNIRELVGVMRRAVALAEEVIDPSHLDLTANREVAVTLTEEMAAAERVKLARAMKENGDSPSAAARALGIPRTTLLMKLKRYGMR